MPAYTELAGRSWADTAFRCFLASLGDVAMTLAICGIGALAARRWRWAVEGGWHIYGTAGLLGAVLATAFEWKALAAEHWSYNECMPIVPVLGVGLWPVLQLMVLVPMSMAAAAWLAPKLHWPRAGDETS